MIIPKLDSNVHHPFSGHNKDMTPIHPISFLIIFISSAILSQNITFNIFILHDAEINALPELDEAIQFISKNFDSTLNVKKILAENRDPAEFLDKLCKEYENSVREMETPHLIFDSTQSIPIKKAVKYFTKALALPTVTSAITEYAEFDPWSDIDENEKTYLLPMITPVNSIIGLLKYIIIRQNMTNFVILHDRSFDKVGIFSKVFNYFNTRNAIISIESEETIDDILSNYTRYFSNFFIAGSLHNIRIILEVAQSQSLFQNIYSWYAVTLEDDMLECTSCKNAKIIFIQPCPRSVQKHRIVDYSDFLLKDFYYNLFIGIFLSLRNSTYASRWIDEELIDCESYNGTNTPHRKNIDLRKIFEKNVDSMLEPSSEFGYMPFSMDLKLIHFRNMAFEHSTGIGRWISHIDNRMELQNQQIWEQFVVKDVLKVLVVEQKPFLFLDASHPKGFNGYLVDMMENISVMLGVDYTLKLASDNTFGDLDDNGNWNGLIKDIMDSKADIGLASLLVTSTRDEVIDFTEPYYKPVGSIILMKLFRTETSFNKFIDVMETNVWLCILVALFITSLLLWVFDKFNPDNDPNRRIFSLKESLWFCFLSMTPQGTGDLPINLSGRIIAVVWWLFSFIILASYTANLSAILTVSLLANPIESMEDLEKEYKLQYAALNGSSTMQYFMRMAHIEDMFFGIWKNITFNEQNTELDLPQYSIWTYPIPDRFTNIWNSMMATGLPETMDEVLHRIRESASPSDGFAFIGDATDCRYLEMTNCDLQTVGDEFSGKPYALAVPQGSPLKERLDLAIFELMQSRVLEQLETKWWKLNPARMDCGKKENQFDGIGIRNMAGVFMLIILGIIASTITLIVEFYWFKLKRRNGKLNKEKLFYPGLEEK